MTGAQRKLAEALAGIEETNDGSLNVRILRAIAKRGLAAAWPVAWAALGVLMDALEMAPEVLGEEDERWDFGTECRGHVELCEADIEDEDFPPDPSGLEAHRFIGEFMTSDDDGVLGAAHRLAEVLRLLAEAELGHGHDAAVGFCMVDGEGCALRSLRKTAGEEAHG